MVDASNRRIAGFPSDDDIEAEQARVVAFVQVAVVGRLCQQEHEHQTNAGDGCSAHAQCPKRLYPLLPESLFLAVRGCSKHERKHPIPFDARVY